MCYSTVTLIRNHAYNSSDATQLSAPPLIAEAQLCLVSLLLFSEHPIDFSSFVERLCALTTLDFASDESLQKARMDETHARWAC